MYISYTCVYVCEGVRIRRERDNERKFNLNL